MNTQPLRLLAESYDNSVQSQSLDWTDEGTRDAFHILLGRLRLDALLYDRIILKDGDIFFGNLFLEAARLGALPELPWDRIEVRSRAPTLNQSIMNALIAPNAMTLVPTFLVCLPWHYNSQLSEFSRKLGRRDAGDITSPRDFSVALTDVGVTEEDANELVESWRKLDDHFANFRPHWVEWPKGVPFSFDQNIAKHRDGVRVSLTHRGRKLFDAITPHLASRNVVYAKLLDAEPHLTSEDELADLDTLRAWYSWSYKTAQAQQHNCNTLEMSVGPRTRGYGDLDLNRFIVEIRREIQVPPLFFRNLGTLPAREFDRIRFNQDHPTVKGIMLWREFAAVGNEANAVDNLRKSIVALAETPELALSSPTPTWLLATERAALTGSAAIVANALANQSRRKFLWTLGGTTTGTWLSTFIPSGFESRLTKRISQTVVRTVYRRKNLP